MDQLGTVAVRVGASIWWCGEVWQVAALSGRGVTVAHGDRTALVDIGVLATDARPIDLECPGEGGSEPELMSTVTLSALRPEARRRVAEQSRVIAKLLAGDGEWTARLTSAAEELGVSVRTLQRQINAFQRRGAAGLVDARTSKAGGPRIDPRWDQTCLSVLRSYTSSSTPTRGAVIDEVNRQLAAALGPDVVPIPHRATAYRRLETLSKGKYTFGSAKARRSVADRPQRALGRLRADRPGQYVVLDTNDLDVFAMEPVTCRWALCSSPSPWTCSRGASPGFD